MVLLTIFNHNAPLLIGCMVLTVLIALIGVSPQFNHNSRRGINGFSLFLLTLFTSVFCIQSGDFVYTTKVLQSGFNFQHLELFYQNLWLIIPDALIWRFIVFGTSVVLLFATINILKVNTKFAYFIFVLTQFFYFGQMRNMFGFMLMFFSIAVLFRYGNKKHHFVGILISIIGLWASSFLHKSMWLYLMLLIPAIIPFGKKIIRISIISFPFLYGLIFGLSSWFLSTFASEEMQQHSEFYTDSVKETTIMQTIIDGISQMCYINLLYIILDYYCKKKGAFPPVMNFLTRYAFILMYIGFLFYGQATGEWLYVRFAGAGEIALMFVMMWFYYRYPRTKGVKIAFSGFIFCLLYKVLYISTYASHGFITRFNAIDF